MTGVEYQVFVDGQPATRELTRAIDRIEVSQLMRAPWEATIVIPVCMNARGEWDHEAEDYVRSRTRFRIEVRVGGVSHALIDGVTTGAELGMTGDPGQSSITVRVQDDTDELERDRAPRTFGAERGLVDVVRELIGSRTHLEEAHIDEPEETREERHAPNELTMGGGTSVYDYLRGLADDNGKYIYVLPGDRGGRSQLHFRSLPQPTNDRAPELILAGPERNIESLEFSTSSNRPGRAVSRSINIRERTVETRTVTLSNRAGAGSGVAVDEEVEVHLTPRQIAAVGPDQAAAATLERLGYVIRGDGAVEGRCYAGVLQPYSYVDVRGVNPSLTGTCLIYSVTHRLSRAGYRQDFTLWRNTLTTTQDVSSSGTSASGMHPW